MGIGVLSLGVERPRRESDHSLPFCRSGAIPSLPHYAFMCLHGDKFKSYGFEVLLLINIIS